MLDLLAEQDRVALVAYDDEVLLLSPSVPATAETRSVLKHKVNELKAGNTTFLSGGWLQGCQEVAASIKDGSTNRALLLTDGLANRGITDLEELAHHASELNNRGVSTSTFGVGEDFNEHLLEKMANQGGGTFYFISRPAEIPQIFVRELKEMAAVTAREVQLVLMIPAGVALEAAGGWRQEQAKNELRISLGDLASGQERRVYVRLLAPPAVSGTRLTMKGVIQCRAEDGQPQRDEVEVEFTYTEGSVVAAAPKEYGVLERYSVVEVGDVANEALKLERQGDLEKASRLLEQSLQLNRPYLSESVAQEVEELSARMKYGLREGDRKSSHYQNYLRRQTRSH
ncbi:MAG: VWA domain-containing protein [Chloroflexi bacterium]|nr:VWA domain-containing protein [Chloroflexota bacterium]